MDSAVPPFGGKTAPAPAAADDSCEFQHRVIMIPYLWVALGGALGTAGRFAVSGLVANSVGGTFPWGTFVVNVTGSFVIGFFGTLTAPDGRMLVGGTARQFFMTGVCGGYTTFSSFSLQTLAQDREWFRVGAATPNPET
jgi:fluoride exporter